MSTSTLGLLTSLGAFGIYSYSLYYLSGLNVKKGFSDFVPKQLQVYGLLKFLTIQCLFIQILSTLLHILAHFVRTLRGFRDLVFTTLALPVGSVVVYTFWLVWFGMGREQIFPAHLDAFYPPWLNHVTHTIVAPINILLAMQINHKYTNNGVLVTLVYLLGYTILLHVIKAQTGLFVYGYMNTLNDNQRMVYFLGSAVFAYLIYKSGQLIKNLTFGGERTAPARKQAPKGQKQR